MVFGTRRARLRAVAHTICGPSRSSPGTATRSQSVTRSPCLTVLMPPPAPNMLFPPPPMTRKLVDSLAGARNSPVDSGGPMNRGVAQRGGGGVLAGLAVRHRASGIGPPREHGRREAWSTARRNGTRHAHGPPANALPPPRRFDRREGLSVAPRVGDATDTTRHRIPLRTQSDTR